MMPHPIFAHPLLLLSLALLLALGFLSLWRRQARRQARARFGHGAMIEALLTRRGWRQGVRGVLLLAGMFSLGIGMAGPQWGRDWDQATAPGRDLVVVVDCSRSMMAENPSRLERARTALLDLSETIAKRSGHRLALVLFASRARLICPLTHDYDHFREMVRDLEDAALDPELGPGPGVTSGTRIGRGITQAVLAHDPRFQGARDIVLLSDGDDPARDGEWRQGALEAKALGIPVHPVGLGDPDAAHPIPQGKSWLQHDGQPVRTRLQEAPLREIAEFTGATLVIPGTSTLPLGKHYLEVIATLPEREESDDALPVYQQHYALLLGPAFALLASWMSIPDRVRRPRQKAAGTRDVTEMSAQGL
jgi:Ca-activated chloride channel family protein